MCYNESINPKEVMMMTPQRTVTVFCSRFLSEALTRAIACAKFAQDAPAYAEQLAYMMFCDHYETDCFHVVATDQDERVCGYLYCIRNWEEPTLWYYGDLFVVPEARRQGIASRMVRAAMRQLSDMGAAVLRCYVEDSNTASLGLQASLGFRQKAYEKFNDIDNDGQLMLEVELPSCLSVRQITSADAKYVMALYTENKKALHGSRISYKEFQELLSVRDPDELNLLICKGALPVAWLKLNGLSGGETAWVSTLVVHNKFRHQGIGRFALRYAEEYVREKQISVLKLHTTGDNLPAVRLYQSMGYALEATEQAVFEDGEAGERLTLVKRPV